MEMRQVVCPWTGGVDTTYLVQYLLRMGYDVYPYHIDYGNMNAPAEWWAIEHMIPLLQGMKFRGTLHEVHRMMFFIPNLRSVWITGEETHVHQKGIKRTFQDEYDVVCYGWDVPFRNAILFSMGAAYAESLDITDMALAIEHNEESVIEYRDDSWEFAQAFDKLCEISSNVRLQCPITDIDVAERYHMIYDLNLWKYVDVGRCNFPRRNHTSGVWEPCEKCTTCVSSDHIIKRDYGINKKD